MTDQYEGNEDVRPELDEETDGQMGDGAAPDEVDDDGENTPVEDPDDDTVVLDTPEEDAVEDPDDDVDESDGVG